MHSRGITLTELLTAISIAALLSFVAIPSLQELVSRSTALRASTQLAETLRYARSHAVIQGVPVTIRPNSGSWSLGWRVFEDFNTDSVLDPGDNLLRTLDGNRHAIISSTKGMQSHIHFNAQGEPLLSNGAFLAGTISVCPTNKASGGGYHVVMARTGRVRVEAISADECN